MVWVFIEAVVSMVGAYNIVKGAYNMYCDAENIKEQYRNHQKITKEYLKTQGGNINPLTESQFTRFEDEFLVLTTSQVMDPYK